MTLLDNTLHLFTYFIERVKEVKSKYILSFRTCGFADGRHVVSPDSEQIEPSVTTSQKVKLCERGANSRRFRISMLLDPEMNSG